MYKNIRFDHYVYVYGTILLLTYVHKDHKSEQIKLNLFGSHVPTGETHLHLVFGKKIVWMCQID